MKVAWSVLIGDARGKVGPLAATKTRSGPMLRSIRTLRKVTSQSQLEMRAALGGLSAIWRDPSMTANRPGWIALALAHAEQDVFLNYYTRTGLNWFNRCNRNLQLIGEAIILEAPTFAAIANPGTLTLAHDGPPATYFNVTPSTVPTSDNAVIIAATRPLSPGILTLSNQQRNVMVVNPGTNGPWDILAAYTTKFGTPHPDRQIFVQAHYIEIVSGIAGLTAQEGLVW